MSGLEKILEQIKTDSDTRIAAIKGKATLEASELFTKTRLEADNEAQTIIKNGENEADSILRKAHYEASFQKKQMILSEKQLLIKNMFERAGNYIKHVPSEVYFPMMKKIIKKHALSNKKGELLFSAEDLDRLPPAYEILVNMELELKHGSLTISKEPADIDGGFILSYDGIEEDCSIDTLLKDACEKMKDDVNSKLFST